VRSGQGPAHDDRRPQRSPPGGSGATPVRSAGPNRLWVADLTYVSTWSGFAYVAFVVDAYARRILGWRVASTMATSMVLDAIEQAIWTRQQEGVFDLKDVVHHTDRGSQYTSIRFSERLAEAGIQPSVGAVGSSYDNALAETINGLYKTELIRPASPGGPSRKSSWPPRNGSTGSTTAASTNTAVTSRPSNWRPPTTLNSRDQPPAELSHQKVSGLTGAVHTADQSPREGNGLAGWGEFEWHFDDQPFVSAAGAAGPTV